MKIYTDISKIELQKLNQHQYYIYVLENTQGYVKIGISHNIRYRTQSLSGSNAGGSKISRVAVSSPTWLYSLEKTIHLHYDTYRVQGTEWFKGLSFDEVVQFIDSLFEKDEYERCNQNREAYIMKQYAKEIEEEMEMER